jgi:hypothetical protein
MIPEKGVTILNNSKSHFILSGKLNEKRHKQKKRFWVMTFVKLIGVILIVAGMQVECGLLES